MGILDQLMGPTGMNSQQQKQMLMNAPQVTTGQPTYVAPEPSFLNRLGAGAMDYLGDPTNRARLAMAFNTMRLNPDPNIAKMAQSRIETAQAMKLLNQQGNRTADALERAGQTELADLVRANPDLAKTAITALTRSPSAFAEKLAAAKRAYPNLSEAELMDKLLAPSNQTTIDLGEAESSFQKEAGQGQAKFINTLAEGLPAAAALESDVNRLQALSEAVEKGGLSNIPNAMRRLIPQGLDPTFDAYSSQMLGVAQGLRQAGTGAQSERDMDLLIARAGSIGSDVTARRIAHQALLEKASIDRQMGTIARQIQLNASNPQKVQELQAQLDELLMRPAMTNEMRTYLDGLTPDFSLDDIDAELKRRGL